MSAEVIKLPGLQKFDPNAKPTVLPGAIVGFSISYDDMLSVVRENGTERLSGRVHNNIDTILQSYIEEHLKGVSQKHYPSIGVYMSQPFSAVLGLLKTPVILCSIRVYLTNAEKKDLKTIIIGLLMDNKTRRFTELLSPSVD